MYKAIYILVYIWPVYIYIYIYVSVIYIWYLICQVQYKIFNLSSPGDPVVKTPHFQCRGTGLIPGQGTKIPHAAHYGQKIKSKEKKSQG